MRYSIAAAPALLLAACGGGEESVQLQPGQWETTVQFSSIEMPGAPEAALAQMRQMLNQPQTQSQCITPEQAANPSGNMVNPGGEANCEFTENTFAGGEINVQGTCPQPGQGNVQMSMEGNYTPTTMEADISTQMQAPPGTPGGAESIRMAGRLTARRTGDCPSS